jgi:hypothetical protein
MKTHSVMMLRKIWWASALLFVLFVTVLSAMLLWRNRRLELSHENRPVPRQSAFVRPSATQRDHQRGAAHVVTNLQIKVDSLPRDGTNYTVVAKEVVAAVERIVLADEDEASVRETLDALIKRNASIAEFREWKWQVLSLSLSRVLSSLCIECAMRRGSISMADMAVLVARNAKTRQAARRNLWNAIDETFGTAVSEDASLASTFFLCKNLIAQMGESAHELGRSVGEHGIPMGVLLNARGTDAGLAAFVSRVELSEHPTIEAAIWNISLTEWYEAASLILGQLARADVEQTVTLWRQPDALTAKVTMAMRSQGFNVLSPFSGKPFEPRDLASLLLEFAGSSDTPERESMVFLGCNVNRFPGSSVLAPTMAPRE